jgi:hypothetical protein
MSTQSSQSLSSLKSLKVDKSDKSDEHDEWTQYPVLMLPDAVKHENWLNNLGVHNIFEWLNKNYPNWPGKNVPRDIIDYIAKCVEIPSPVISKPGKVAVLSFDIMKNDSSLSKLFIAYAEQQLRGLYDHEYCDMGEVGYWYKRFFFYFYVFEGDKEHLKNSLTYICKYMDDLLEEYIPIIMNNEDFEGVEFGADVENYGYFGDERKFSNLMDVIKMDFLGMFLYANAESSVYAIYCNINNN